MTFITNRHKLVIVVMIFVIGHFITVNCLLLCWNLCNIHRWSESLLSCRNCSRRICNLFHPRVTREGAWWICPMWSKIHAIITIYDCHNQPISSDTRLSHNSTLALSNPTSTCSSMHKLCLIIINQHQRPFISWHSFLLRIDDFFLSFFHTLSICTAPGQILYVRMYECHLCSFCLSFFVFCLSKISRLDYKKQKKVDFL